MRGSMGERTLVARINRALSKRGDGERLHKARPRWTNEFGAYYIHNGRYNGIFDRHLDLEAVAQELGL